MPDFRAEPKTALGRRGHPVSLRTSGALRGHHRAPGWVFASQGSRIPSSLLCFVMTTELLAPRVLGIEFSLCHSPSDSNLLCRQTSHHTGLGLLTKCSKSHYVAPNFSKHLSYLEKIRNPCRVNWWPGWSTRAQRASLVLHRECWEFLE